MVDYKYAEAAPEAENDTGCASMATPTHPLMDLPTFTAVSWSAPPAVPVVLLLFSFIVTVAKHFGAKPGIGLDRSTRRLKEIQACDDIDCRQSAKRGWLGWSDCVDAAVHSSDAIRSHSWPCWEFRGSSGGEMEGGPAAGAHMAQRSGTRYI